MSRSIDPKLPAVYRAVIDWKEPAARGGKAHREYEGPYDTPAAARARVTFWENNLRDSETGETRASGKVEEGPISEWRPYAPPAKKRSPKGGRT